MMPVDQPFLEILSFYIILFQIKESASQTRDVLKQHFNDLKGTLAKLLDERLVTLLQEVDTIEQETIKPLDDCQKLIEHGVTFKHILTHKRNENTTTVASVGRKFRNLALHSLVTLKKATFIYCW